MASAEARAGRTCFRQENFKMPCNFSDNFTSSDCDSINTNSDMKWWLHLKTNLGDDTNYTCQNLNYLESEFLGGDQFVKNFDPLSCVGSVTTTATIGLEQPWNVPSKCLKKGNDTGMLKIEASLNNELHLAPMKKNKGEFWFSNGEFVESDVTSFLVYEQCKSMSSDMESHWIGAEKTRPWWRATGKDDLASLVAQKSLEHIIIENCDLPEPYNKPFRKILPTLQTRETDHGKNSVLSLNQKSEMCSSNLNGCSLTSGCSFQDSERTFSSSQSSRESSDSSNKENHINNSESKNKAELLKALCHSQTRAREAENAAQQAFNEKEHILSLFFKQASQLFAYKQWLYVLQLENLCLQLRNKNLFYKGKQHKKGSRKTKKRRSGIRKCVVAFAVGLALAGAGLLLGWNLGCMFPPF